MDHTDPKRAMYKGWEQLMRTHMKKIPSIPGDGYTLYHYFEIEKGKITMKKTLDDTVPYVHEYISEERIDSVRNAISRSLFGRISFQNASFSDMVLGNKDSCIEIVGNKSIPEVRVRNLQQMYALMPTECLHYYPPSVTSGKNLAQSEEDFAVIRGNIASKQSSKRQRIDDIFVKDQITISSKKDSDANQTSLFSFAKKGVMNTVSRNRFHNQVRIEENVKIDVPPKKLWSDNSLLSWLKKSTAKPTDSATIFTSAILQSGNILDKTTKKNYDKSDVTAVDTNSIRSLEFLKYVPPQALQGEKPTESCLDNDRPIEQRLQIWENQCKRNERDFQFSICTLINVVTSKVSPIFHRINNNNHGFVLEAQENCACWLHALHAVLQKQIVSKQMAANVFPAIFGSFTIDLCSDNWFSTNRSDVNDLHLYSGNFPSTSLTDAFIRFKYIMCARSKLLDGLYKCDLNSICTAFNPITTVVDCENPNGIYLGAKPLLPGTTKRFSDIIEKMKPGNACIIFKGGQIEANNSMGHFVSLWHVSSKNDANSELFYFYDSISKQSKVQLLGPWTAMQFNKYFPSTSSILTAFHRSIYVFNFPLNIASRNIAVKDAINNLNGRLNYIFKEYLHTKNHQEKR